MNAAATGEIDEISRIRLLIDLPAGWKVLPSEVLGERWEGETPEMAAFAQAALTAATTPDLVAGIVQTDQGRSGVTVMVSLIVYCLREPDTSGAELGTVIRRCVPIAHGITADFAQTSILVSDPDTEMNALLTFSTPNLPFLDDMLPGFREIAASVRFKEVAAS